VSLSANVGVPEPVVTPPANGNPPSSEPRRWAKERGKLYCASEIRILIVDDDRPSAG
jgi:hypothetical protein